MKRGVGIIEPEYVIKKRIEKNKGQVYTLAGTGYIYNSGMKYKENDKNEQKIILVIGFDYADTYY